MWAGACPARLFVSRVLRLAFQSALADGSEQKNRGGPNSSHRAEKSGGPSGFAARRCAKKSLGGPLTASYMSQGSQCRDLSDLNPCLLETGHPDRGKQQKSSSHTCALHLNKVAQGKDWRSSLKAASPRLGATSRQPSRLSCERCVCRRVAPRAWGQAKSGGPTSTLSRWCRCLYPLASFSSHPLAH